jgi:type VI secretion system secreted protein VgrG
MWLLTKRTRSRIFQGLTVPQILEMVLQGTKLSTESRDPTGPGLDVKFQFNEIAAFKNRDYCVQYRETDFSFASRLMEEEGIHYFFRHSASGHQLVVTDFPAHPSIFGDDPATPIVFSRSVNQQIEATSEVLFDWQKAQEMRAGKYTLRDHSFEMQTPGQPVFVEASASSAESLQVGLMKHTLNIAGNTTQLEIYDYPGEYVQRFDGVDPAGGDRAADLQNIGKDATRTTAIRMQEETTHAIVITGSSNCTLFSAGRNFNRVDQDKAKEQTLKNDGEYLLIGVTHYASGSDYRSSNTKAFTYYNSFACVPSTATSRRTPRHTPKPIIQGPQTATVVGPADSEIFTDKFGRVKVKFHWDRDSRSDASTSCWVRVAQVWAGKRWGASFWPRIGQEVVVAFLEGDPDQPLIIGSVYNAVQMPPYLGDGLDSKHPKDNKVSGIKSNTTLGGVGFNEWRFDDNKGKEQIFFHAERNMDTLVKNDSNELVINDRSLIVGLEKDGKKSGDQKEKVFKDKHLHILGNQEEHIEGNLNLTIGHGGADDGGTVNIVIEKSKLELIEENSHLHIKKDQAILVDGFLTEIVQGNHAEKIGGQVAYIVAENVSEKFGQNHDSNVAGDLNHKVGSNYGVDAGLAIHIKAGTKIILEAGTQISLVCGSNFIDISSSGISIVGSMVNINSGGAAGSGTGCAEANPKEATSAKDAKLAAPVDPTVADDSKSGQKSAP